MQLYQCKLMNIVLSLLIKHLQTNKQQPSAYLHYQPDALVQALTNWCTDKISRFALENTISSISSRLQIGIIFWQEQSYKVEV